MAVLGGLLGAKLYYVLLHWEWTLRDPVGMIFSRGGMVWYGGFLGGTALVVWQIRKLDLPLPKLADATAPALALAYAVGRVGCFLVGDDYGRPTDSWIGIAFPEGSPPTTAGSLRRHFGVDIPASIPDGQVLAVYPTQIFEVAAGLLIFWILWRLRDHAHRTGWLFSVWLVAAGLERLFIEVFRAKDDRLVGALTVAQVISLALVAVGAWLWWRLRRPSPAGGDADGADGGGRRRQAADG
jgi:phosphatidylglycerol:prolipoprotein diacylglycerol transferase